MNKWFLLLVIAGLAVGGWINREKIERLVGYKVSLRADPLATPHPSPNYAAATKAFPPLGVQGSPFNIKFVELHNQLKASDPGFFAQEDWPMQLAQRTAQEVHFVAAAATPAPTNFGSSLDSRPAGPPGYTVPPTVQLPGMRGSALDQRPAPKNGFVTH
jgi:hypothetical protein